jgi:hypothetical protein
MDVYNAGTLNVSKRICAAVSRLLRGLSGGSVSRTGCCREMKSSVYCKEGQAHCAVLCRTKRSHSEQEEPKLTSSLKVFKPSV